MAAPEKIALKKTARTAGVLYLLMTVLLIVAGYGYTTMITPENSAETAQNILANEGLYRSSIVIDLTGQVCYLLLAWVLYILLNSANKNAAFLMVLFVFSAVVIQCVNLLLQFGALELASGADYLTGFDSEQMQAQMMFFINLHYHGIMIAQIFFGLWLLPLGYLVSKSGFIPKIFGGLLMAACAGYLIDFFRYFLFPENEVVAIPGLVVATLAELSFCFWLLIKGVKGRPGELISENICYYHVNVT